MVGIGFFALIVAVTISFGARRRERLKHSGIKDIDRMEGWRFEEYLGELFRSQGYEVRVTPKTRDFGADIIITKNGSKTVVQAKRYGTAVGLEAVQQAYGSVNYYEAAAAWAVTNNYFTPAAKTLAQVNNVRLIEREELMEMIRHMKEGLGASPETAAAHRRVNAHKLVAAATSVPNGAPNPNKSYEGGPACPKCGQATFIRNTSMGKAYVCVNVASCKFYKVI
jgi:restriction system protein